MRIAHLLPTAIPVTHDRGGAVERRVLGLAREQAAMGHDVTIFAAGEATRSIAGGVGIHGIPCRTNRPLRDYEYLLRVGLALRTQTFDVIHSHGVPDAARFLGGVGGGAFHVLTVDYFRYRLTRYTGGRRHYQRSLRRFDAICAVSHYCRSEFLRFYGGGGPRAERVHVVHNGVDRSQFFPDPAEAARVATAYRLADRLPYVLYLGRINRQKGSSALPGLARALPRATVVAAGPVGQFGRAESDAILGELEASGGAYLGPVPDADLRGLLSGASALVLPTAHDEMFGMVLIEAGACGTPAVASDLGGIPEALGDGGALVAVGDTHALAEKTRQIVEDPAVRGALSAAALENAGRFEWRRIAERYDDVYAGRRS